MDVWIGVLGFVLFLGFFIAVMICLTAIKRKNQIIIKSRLHRKLGNAEVIYANLGLLLLVVSVYFHVYAFVPGILAFVLFVVLTTQVQSGLTDKGVLIGTVFEEWEFIKGYCLIDDESDSNIIILKLRIGRKQYVLVCNREDRFLISDMMKKNGVKPRKLDGGKKH